MKNLNRYLNYLILALVSVYAVIYFSAAKVRSTAVPKPAEITDIDQVVNKFLKQTSEQTRKDEMAFRLALEKQLKKPLNIKKETREKKPDDSVENQQNLSEAAASITPSEVIQTGIYRREIEKQQEELDKKEYARQFVENARKSGFHLVLSEDNKVISVTPIRKPSQTDESSELFPAD